MRFYEELNDFLPVFRRKKPFSHDFNQAGSVKDLIESLGVPHTEVDLILINGVSVNFNHVISDGDHISVYPRFESLDISTVTRLRRHPLRRLRFVLDVHLGRLAAYLRMLGFDTLYRNDYSDPALVQLSVDEQRVLLTRDKGLLMRKRITRGYYVREQLPQKQLREIFVRFDLCKSQRPFTRCMHCNAELQRMEKTAVEADLMPRTKSLYDRFWQCARCKKIYWQGSHYRRMQQCLATLEHSLMKNPLSGGRT